MKEASGELSMTAVAVVAIAAVGVLFTTVIWPNIKSSLTHNQACSAAYSCSSCSGGKCSCFYAPDEKGNCYAGGTKDGSGNCPITCTDPNTAK